MRAKILTFAAIAILVVALGQIYGRWVAAESRARVAEIEAALADTMKALEAARNQERADREERQALRAALEEARQADVAAADTAHERAIVLAATTDGLIEQIEPPALRQAIEAAVEEERTAREAEPISLRLALIRADSIIDSLEADTLSLHKELRLADQQTAAVERANKDLRGEITTLQNKLSPSFVTRILRTGRDVGIGVGIGLIASKL